MEPRELLDALAVADRLKHPALLYRRGPARKCGGAQLARGADGLFPAGQIPGSGYG